MAPLEIIPSQSDGEPEMRLTVQGVVPTVINATDSGIVPISQGRNIDLPMYHWREVPKVVAGRIKYWENVGQRQVGIIIDDGSQKGGAFLMPVNWAQANLIAVGKWFVITQNYVAKIMDDESFTREYDVNSPRHPQRTSPPPPRTNHDLLKAYVDEADPAERERIAKMMMKTIM